MSNLKGLPGHVECSDHQPRPLHGIMHGYVRLLAKSPRHKTATFFLNDRKISVKASVLPGWFTDGAHVEIELAEQTTFRLITPARKQEA